MSHEVFISYSARDKAVADAACRALETAGFHCWMAPRDIRPGDTWGQAIVEAIDGSRVMVVVFSRHSNASPQVVREIERAVRKQLKVVPFRIDSVRPSGDMDYFLATTHWLDAFGPDLDVHLAELVDAASGFLRGGAGGAGARPAQGPPPLASPGARAWSRLRVRGRDVAAACARLGRRARSAARGLDPRIAWSLAGVTGAGVAAWAGFAWLPTLEPAVPTVGEVAVAEATPAAPLVRGTPAVEASGPADMIEVPAGEFFFGCGGPQAGDCRGYGGTGRRRYLEAFWIDRTEVSSEAYSECVLAAGCSAPETGPLCNWEVGDRLDHPVNCVTWAQARDYCEWRGRRLPSEAEWEKAARGSDQRGHAWGAAEATCDHAVLHVDGGCGTSGTAPVDAKPRGASPLGVLGMTGNVQEWTADWYAARQRRRVARGGNWNSVPAAARVWRRDPLDPDKAPATVGFRCAR